MGSPLVREGLLRVTGRPARNVARRSVFARAARKNPVACAPGGFLNTMFDERRISPKAPKKSSGIFVAPDDHSSVTAAAALAEVVTVHLARVKGSCIVSPVRLDRV